MNKDDFFKKIFMFVRKIDFFLNAIKKSMYVLNIIMKTHQSHFY